MIKRWIYALVLCVGLLLPSSHALEEQTSLDDIVMLLDTIATKHHEVDEVFISYIFSNNALQSQEFVYILLYFETMGWNSYIFSLSEQNETLIIFFTPQVAMLRSLNQSLVAALFTN